SLILKEIIRELRREFMTLATSAMEAREAATSEEAKAENKYDTRGLEASYLAGAQAERARDVRKTLDQFQRLEVKKFDPDTPIGATALIETRSGDNPPKWYFLLAMKGGITVEVGGQSIMTLSLDSPLGQELKSRRTGDIFNFKVKNEDREYEIVQVL
ncbi:MAG: GreA/GreB family elongation factor, partial [Bdellovibrionales bacterium]|nr:GreA/GreB family elongation factor [Bdellovibrionales bacterium]